MSLGLTYQLPAPFHSDLLTRFNGLETPEDHPLGALLDTAECRHLGTSQQAANLPPGTEGSCGLEVVLLRCNCRLADNPTGIWLIRKFASQLALSET
jgi:hypothetical protein